MSKIFESPDGGKTVYQREFGARERTLVSVKKHGDIMEDGYTEYGYRGLEEIKRLEGIIDKKNKDIEECNKLINDLKITVQELREKWQN
tara:strand:+ start:336 stop:602 length:267 start_codon:yes stop_codon:yes gene_type:complete